MNLKTEYEQILQILQQPPKEIVFPSTYTPGDPLTVVNFWGFIPAKLIAAGQNSRYVLYWIATDEQQWTAKHLIVRSSGADITYKILALR